MKDLVEALEASDLPKALELARGYAESADMLAETIIGNVQHVMGMWVDVQAARWERKANEVEHWEAAESYLSRAHAYRDVARGIREGAWRE